MLTISIDNRFDLHWWALLALGALGLVVTGCARPIRPDDMSAQAHRRDAAREHAASDAQAREFDSNAVVRAPAVRDAPNLAVEQYSDYNPTQWHLKEAARHSQHARDHERAAAELEAFEEAECRAFQPAVRSACPLLGPIESAEEIEDGVRLRLAPGAPVDAVVAHVRCHLAYARSRAFQVPSCPLTLRGVEVTASDDGTSIVLTSRDRKMVRQLKQLTIELVGKAAPARR